MEGTKFARVSPEAENGGKSKVTPNPDAPAARISVPSDRKARYYLLAKAKRPDGLLEITTKRDGSSGESFSTRVVDCAAGRFEYAADGDSWEDFQHSRHEPASLSPLTYGSVSYYVALHACGNLPTIR